MKFILQILGEVVYKGYNKDLVVCPQLYWLRQLHVQKKLQTTTKGDQLQQLDYTRNHMLLP